ncbi:MAG: protein involved in biosynthesis of mitomycin antibiotics/polyketide fumonisin [Candidatus Roseilinea sp.]|nr:MAG: protein involved in biosynthesis of mitomycin antibiotics/polyketide fumonisin [Candidatus Roseilinea sp.]
MLTPEQRSFYDTQGYLIVRELFSREEVEFYKAHYMRLRGQGTYPGDLAGVDVTSNDPLKKYPRMIHMHRWDEISLKWMIDPRLNAYLTALTGREPYAVQTMLYFKPPGARGQALHQDQYYLRAKPGTCIAAWMALDDCDEENGCLQLVPGSQHWPVLCTIPADTTQSFTDVTVPLPEGTPVVPAIMQAGDVLFFNGQIVHGSLPNRSPHRFRRALIGHYIEGHAEIVARFYHPVLKMDGTPLELGQSQDGSECGVWVERDGRRTIELAAVQSGPVRTE